MRKKKENGGKYSCVACHSEVTASFFKPGQDAEKLTRRKFIIKREGGIEGREAEKEVAPKFIRIDKE